MPVAKSNMFSSNSIGVVSSSTVRRPESKDSNLKNNVLLHTKSKSTSKDVKKSQSSVSLVSNKHDTLNSNVSKSKANVLNAKIVNAVKISLNLKFMETIRFGNDHFTTITGYGDYVQGNFTIYVTYTMLRVLDVTPPKSQRIGIPLGVLLHSIKYKLQKTTLSETF
ncbi:hypothetical protein Tco_1448128 [Tanacetum coccineum]